MTADSPLSRRTLGAVTLADGTEIQEGTEFRFGGEVTVPDPRDDSLTAEPLTVSGGPHTVAAVEIAAGDRGAAAVTVGFEPPVGRVETPIGELVQWFEQGKVTVVGD